MNKSEPSTPTLDAVEILRADHAELRQVFADFFAARETRRYDLVPGLCEAVTRHMALDAQIFYPQLARAMGNERLAFGAVAEYVAVNDFVEELLYPDPGDFGFSERVYRLATMVDHHVKASEGPDGAFACALSSTMNRAAVAGLLQRRKREWSLDDASPGPRRACSG